MNGTNSTYRENGKFVEDNDFPNDDNVEVKYKNNIGITKYSKFWHHCRPPPLESVHLDIRKSHIKLDLN